MGRGNGRRVRTDVPPSCGPSTTDPRPTLGSSYRPPVAASSRLSWRTVVMSTVLALLAAAATVVLLSDDPDEDVATTPITLVPEEEVPTFDEATYVTFDGEEVPLSGVRGTPTVVNFFSSTCTPCITEMPAFEEVYQDVKGSEEVAFLGLAVADRTDDAQALVEGDGRHLPDRGGQGLVGDQCARGHGVAHHGAARRRREHRLDPRRRALRR